MIDKWIYLDQYIFGILYSFIISSSLFFFLFLFKNVKISLTTSSGVEPKFVDKPIILRCSVPG